MRTVILGAGFGGLELSTCLSESLGSVCDVVLIDKSETFTFGFSKLDVMFGRKRAEEVKVPYRDIAKPGVSFRQETIVKIEPVEKRVTTDKDVYQADFLVVALGADYDQAATPGLIGGAEEFYSFEGAVAAADALANFKGGRLVVAVTTPNFKCPPAPNEAALMAHDFLTSKGLRDKSEISIVSPMPIPIPVSQATSQSILEALAERNIPFRARTQISGFDREGGVIRLSDGESVPYDLALAVPVHRPPDVIRDTGIDTAGGWIQVESRTLKTAIPDVWALGDVAAVGVPRAGVFSEGQARVVAQQIIDRVEGRTSTELYDGVGICYLEMGGKDVGKVNVNFLGGPQPTATFTDPTTQTWQEKQEFGASRTARWFGN